MLFTSIFIITLTNCNGLIIEDSASYGTTFDYLGSLTVSSNFHLLAFQIDINMIIQAVDHSLTAFHAFHKNPLYKELDQESKDALKEIKAFLVNAMTAISSITRDQNFNHKNPLEHHRHSRGLINAVGQAGEWLFGLATYDEIAELTSGIGIINATTNALVSQLNVHTSLLNKLAPDVEDLQSYAKLTKTALETISNNIFINEFKNDLAIQLSRANHLLAKLNTIDIGIKAMASGTLAYELITKADFQAALDILIERGIRLLFNKEDRSTIYSNICKVISIPNPDSLNIRYAVFLPTDSVAESLEVYKINTFYAYNETLGAALRYKIDYPFLGVSSDLTSISVMDSLENCEHFNRNYWCPKGLQLQSSLRHICEAEIFYHRQPQLYCEMDIESIEEPIFATTTQGFQFAAPSPTPIIVQCEKGHAPEKHIIHGNGLIKLAAGCRLHQNGVVLFLPVIYNQSMVNSSTWITIKPVKLSTLHNFTELDGLMREVNLTSLRQLKLGSSKYSYGAVTQHLKLMQLSNVNVMSFHHSHYIGIGIGVIFIIVIFFVVAVHV